MADNLCKYCDTPLTWILTAHKGKWAPCEAHPVFRPGSAPLPRGKYYDSAGNLYNETDAPNQTKLFRAHHPDCRGAKKEPTL